jgi:hypothetical protein
MTLCPSVYTFDSAEFVTGAYSLGIVHATGYPLYLLLAKLFTLSLPIGDIAFRVNLFSAICGALGLAVLRRVAYFMTGSTRAAFLGTAFLGISYPFWSEAVVAEVYTLHVFFLSSILGLTLYWRSTGKVGAFIALGLVMGLSFGNHMSTILIVPGVAYLVWETIRYKHIPMPGFDVWIRTGVASLVGPLTYLYLPLRYAANPALNYAALVGVDLNTFKGIFWMVRGTMFTNSMFNYTLAEIPEESWQFLALLWQTFLGVGLILAAAGFLNMWKRDKPLLLALSLIFMANVIFYVNYRVFDKETMFLPVFMTASLWIAVGTSTLLHKIGEGIPRQVVFWALVGILISSFVLVYPRVNLKNNWITRQFAQEVFQQAPTDALIVGGWIDITPLVYLQVVENQRPDLMLFDYGLYILGRQSILQESGMSLQTSRQIAYNEIRLEVANQLSLGRPAFSLGDNPILEPAFDQAAVSQWLYAITPLDYERLRP